MTSATVETAQKPRLVLEATSPWSVGQLVEAWRFRDVLYFLVWRDLKVRYKQTLLGASWAVIQPFFAMVIFSIFLGKLAKMPSDGIPYPVFSYCALLPWQLFSNSLTQAGNSLVANQAIISKVYFPRLLIPVSVCLGAVVDFCVAFGLLILMMLVTGIMPTWTALAAPLFVVMATLAALGTGLWLAALNARYRDVRYVIPFLAQVWLYASPVAYPASIVPEGWRALYGLNPMVGVIEGFRWALLGRPDFPAGALVVSTVTILATLVGGAIYFRRVERTLADLG